MREGREADKDGGMREEGRKDHNEKGFKREG